MAPRVINVPAMRRGQFDVGSTGPFASLSCTLVVNQGYSSMCRRYALPQKPANLHRVQISSAVGPKTVVDRDARSTMRLLPKGAPSPLGDRESVVSPVFDGARLDPSSGEELDVEVRRPKQFLELFLQENHGCFLCSDYQPSAAPTARIPLENIQWGSVMCLHKGRGVMALVFTELLPKPNGRGQGPSDPDELKQDGAKMLQGATFFQGVASNGADSEEEVKDGWTCGERMWRIGGIDYATVVSLFKALAEHREERYRALGIEVEKYNMEKDVIQDS